MGLEELGATMPEHKNLENLGATIDSLASYEPGSLPDFKRHLDDGTAQDAFPVGTEIPDTWDGKDNPLIVGTYQYHTNDDGELFMAAGLLRKFVEPSSSRAS